MTKLSYWLRFWIGSINEGQVETLQGAINSIIDAAKANMSEQLMEALHEYTDTLNQLIYANHNLSTDMSIDDFIKSDEMSEIWRELRESNLALFLTAITEPTTSTSTRLKYSLIRHC